MEGQGWQYVNGFRVLVSRTEIRLVWLQDEKEAMVLWLPRAVAEALVPALQQALAQQEQAAEGRPSEAQAGAGEAEGNLSLSQARFMTRA